ncbi:MAG: CBS domain-containing protein [Solirubrobacteraceae bacterium]|nr:CBS domain-containing protein [Solirubrobacteraceae bacterium]
MTRDPETVAPDAPVTEVAELMRDTGMGMIAVTEGERLRGVVTDRDIVIRAVAAGKDLDLCAVGDIASAQLTTVAPDDDVATVAQRMRDADVRRVPVVDDTRVVGVISVRDLDGQG